MTPPKQAGILLHITSLPEGNLGPDAFHFIDLLADLGITVWQTLPVNLPHGDQSPYQSLSAHAGHTGMISPQSLLQQGWCHADELALELFSLLAKVMTRVQSAAAMQPTTSDGLSWSGFARFCQQHQPWLDDFALFLALREHHGYQSWQHWPAAYKHHETAALQAFTASHLEALQLIKFAQYVFFSQWAQLKSYANQRKVQLFGDIPIFVAYDSADVWAHPYWFKLDDSGQMTVVAGVPPDYFSATGQRWGNPHYDWDTMQADGFQWWLGRVAVQSQLFDILRIDHFRGLQAAWEIPASEPTAILGQWQEAPGAALLSAITQKFPNLKLVAEDLGIITPEVDALRLQFGLHGMKILQFAFGGGDDNPYLPAQIDENSVAYTGTHDNDTTLGWYQTASAEVQQHVQRYLNQTEPAMPKALIELTLASAAYLAIIPMQDVLGLDSRARMNVPGTVEGNWAWRMQWSQFSKVKQQSFKNLLKKSGRSHG